MTDPCHTWYSRSINNNNDNLYEWRSQSPEGHRAYTGPSDIYIYAQACSLVIPLTHPESKETPHFFLQMFYL